MRKIIFIFLFIPVIATGQFLHNGTGNTLLSTGSDVGGASNYVNAPGSATFGVGNIIKPNPKRGQVTNYGFIGGNGNHLSSWSNWAFGVSNYVDGKDAGAAGNNNIASGTDSKAYGELSVTGRFKFPVKSDGTDTLIGIGKKYYTIIDPVWGNVCPIFPNKLNPVDSSIYWYSNSSYVLDTGGNVNLLTRALEWAMHPYGILEQVGSEGSDIIIKIVKCDYTGLGSKIYWDTAVDINKTIAYSSCGSIPGKPGTRWQSMGGNGATTLGDKTNATGGASLATGLNTRAWGETSFTWGQGTLAWGKVSMAGGTESFTNYYSQNSTAWGYRDTTNGINAHTYGSYQKINKGNTFGIAIGTYSLISATTAGLTLGSYNVGASNYGISIGYEAKTIKDKEIAYASGKIVNPGDAQTRLYSYSTTKTGVGWHEIPFFTIEDTISVYSFELNVIVKDITKDSTSYGQAGVWKVTGAFSTWGKAGLNYQQLGTPVVTLIGENFTGNVNVSWYGRYTTTNKVDLKFDGMSGDKYDIFVSVKLTQLSTKYH